MVDAYTDFAFTYNSGALPDLKDQMRKEIRKLVKEGEGYWPEWDPPADWPSATREHIKKRRIWKVPGGSLPDLHTYCLGELRLIDSDITRRFARLRKPKSGNW